MKHERRVVGHVSGWQEQMNTCVCGKPWPCTELLPSKTVTLADEIVAMTADMDLGYDRSIEESMLLDIVLKARIAQKLQPSPAETGCKRSHPHEEMNAECERLTGEMHARRTAEYWKAEHNAANDVIAEVREILGEFNSEDVQVMARRAIERIRELEGSPAETSGDARIGPAAPDNDLVICPLCTSQFRAVPVNVQKAVELERQRLVSWADRLSKKGRNDESMEVRDRIDAIDHAMRPPLKTRGDDPHSDLPVELT